MRRARFVLAIIAIIAGTARFLAAATPAGTEFQVNTFTLDAQAYPQICTGGNGNFVVTWESRGQDGSGNAVIARRFGSDGGPLDGEFQVNTYTSGNQQFPAIACDQAGDFVVAWEGRQEDGNSYGVFAQRFRSDGGRLGTEFQVNTYTPDRQLSAAVCMAPSGDFVVTWNSYGQDGDGYGIFGQRFGSDGAQRGTEFQVNTYTNYTQEYPAMTCGGSGDFVVVWVSDYQDGDDYGIFGQRFASSGAMKGTEFQVNTYTYYAQQSPAVSSDAAGDFVVVWSTYQYTTGYSYGIFGQRFGSSGAPLGTEFQANTYTSYVQQSPAVSSDPCGNFTVVWSGGTDGDGYGIFGQLFDKSGAPVGTQFQVNTYTTGDQGTFSALGHVVDVAADGTGNFTVVWQSENQPNDSSSFGVFGQRYAQDICSLSACIGDCNGDGQVTINELVLSVDIALDVFPLSDCPAINPSGIGNVTVDNVVRAVQASLTGCSGSQG